MIDPVMIVTTLFGFFAGLLIGYVRGTVVATREHERHQVMRRLNIPARPGRVRNDPPPPPAA